MSSFASHAYEGILTCDQDSTNCLREQTLPLPREEWSRALMTAEKLMEVRENILKGGAGLAAPQIGINEPVFIFTPDRTAENLRVAINPSFEPVGEEVIEGDEACFSVPLHCVKLKRWEKIRATYQNLKGDFVEEILDGFAAKVFQHEMDHLRGKLTIDHETADVLRFTTPHAFEEHMKQVHVEDAKRYGRK